MENF
jgi:hypothetical protein